MPKDMDFYAGLKEIKVKESLSPAVVVLGLLIAITVGLQGGSAILVHTANESLLQRIDKTRTYLTDPNNKAVAEDTLYKRAVVSLYEQYGSTTGEAYARYYTLPVLDSAGFARIAACMPSDMKVVRFTMDAGNLVMDCECKNEDTPVVFVNALRAAGTVNGIVYNGYTVSSDGVVAFQVSGVYQSGDKK